MLEVSMALKDILLAASIGATMLSSTSTEATPSFNEVTHAQRITPEKKQKEKFSKNYHYLYQNVSGAWFSFGDEEEMRQALHNISSLPKGYEIIAGLPKKLKLHSSNFLRDKDGVYRADSKIVVIDTEVTETRNGLMRTMFHELLHAYQQEQGIALNNNEHPSVEQSLHAGILTEAEARAWDIVLDTTVLASILFRSSEESVIDHKPFLTPKQVDEFMQSDLMGRMQKIMQGKGRKFDEKSFKENNELYQLQQTLIACKGNCNLAQKKMVGQMIKKLMSEHTKWNKYYNKQTYTNTKISGRRGQLSEQGNLFAYQKMLDYYKKGYGLTDQDISNRQLLTEYSGEIKKLKNELKEDNLYSDSKNQLNIYFAQRNNSGR